jgi:hypothetical protein
MITLQILALAISVLKADTATLQSSIEAKGVLVNENSNIALVMNPVVKFSGPYLDGYSAFAFYASQEMGNRICAHFGFDKMASYDKYDPYYRSYIDAQNNITVQKTREGYAFENISCLRSGEVSPMEPSGSVATKMTSKITSSGVKEVLGSDSVLIENPRLTFSSPYLDGHLVFGFYASQAHGDRICAQFGYGKMLSFDKVDPYYRAYIDDQGNVSVQKTRDGYTFGSSITCENIAGSSDDPLFWIQESFAENGITKRMAQIRSSKSLDLSYIKLDADRIDSLGELEGIEELNLTRTGFSNGDLERLLSFKNLKSLNLTGNFGVTTRENFEGLLVLLEMDSLKVLYVGDTGIDLRSAVIKRLISKGVKIYK